jgi:hypothetical protein
MTRSVRTGLAALVLLACTACHPTVMGNGVFAERTFDVAAFDRLDVGYGFTVNVVAGASARSLVISGDENIIAEYLTVQVAGSTLRIDHDEDFIRVHPITVNLDATELVAVTAREGIRMTAGDVDAAAFSVRATEGSEVLLSGAPPAGAALTASLDSGSTLDARAFPVASAAVALTSHSSAQLTCSGPVTGSASDVSVISVLGGGTCQVALSGSVCVPVIQGP